MNGLEIIILGVIVLCAYWGYRAGLLRVVYSLLSWILVLGFVTWATPYITEYLEKNTKLEAAFEEKCRDYIQQAAVEKLEEQVDQEQDTTAGEFLLPENIMNQITDQLAGAAAEILETSGIYEEIAETIAHFIIEGIAFFIALVLSGIFMRTISHMLNLVSHLPVIHGANKILGAAAGAIKGLIIVWLVFYFLALCAASEPGIQILGYVKESRFLLYLYNHNVLLQIIMRFL